MLSRGLDPNEYDMTPAGRVFRKQPAVVEEPQREVMSKPRAFGTSFLGNLLPSAAGLGGAKLGMEGGAALGAFGGPYAPVTVPIGAILGAISGGLGAGYLGGKAQEAVLEKVAPEAIAEMQRAYTDQPVASYVGGFAPSALAFRPSLQGMGALLQPTKRGTATLGEALTNPNFLAPASNIAANVGASSAGQLINVAEGGEFSAPRFAADVVLGTLFNRPTALGRAMGFKDMPQGRPVERPNLAAATERTSQERADIERMTGEMDLAAQNLEQLRQTPAAAERVGEEIRTPEQYFTPEGKPLTEERRVRDYSKWWKSETEPTTELIKGAAEEVQMKVPKDKLAELANDPEVGEVLRDPSKMEAFVAKQADQTLEDVYQMMQRRRAREFATAEEAANQKAFRELQAERDLTQKTITPEAMELLGKVDKGGVPGFITNNLRRIAQENGIVVTDADTPNTVIQRLRDLATLSDVEAAYAASKVNAADAAREVYTRLQRAPEEGPRKITQQDVDFAAEVAARRGLKIELERAFAGDKEVRGMYFTDPKTGDRIIRVNPLMATPDTAIHEVGHDIFRGVTNTGMRRSLMETAMDSPAYKSELAAREAEVKAGFLTPEKAQEIALEEGLIQAFGEQVPNINRGELRAWFAAFKASMKQLVTGKMTPQDALAWMHYASMEAVPWKGVAVAKPGEERMQRGPVDDTAYLKAVDKAVESGDTAEVQRMVDEAAKAAGYTIEGWHGTNRQFNEFNFLPSDGLNLKEPHYFFWDARRKNNAYKFGKNVIHAFLKIENPATTKMILDGVDTGVLPSEMKSRGYDGFLREDGAIIVFDPTQIKSADPITRDDAGNIIPLSQRFKASSEDIRYQREETKTRKLAGRVAESETVPEEVRQTVRESPESQYETQNMAEVRDRTSTMSLSDLNADMIDQDSNTRVASGMEIFGRQIRSGDMLGASKTALALAKSGTTWGQLINQFKLLNSSTPEGLVRLVQQSMDKKKRGTMTDVQAAVLMDGMNRLKVADEQILVAQQAARAAFGSNDYAATIQSLKQLDLADAKRAEVDMFLNEAIAKINPADAADLFISMVQGSVMSPISIVRNVVGNLINYPLREIGDFGAYLIDGALSKDRNNSFNIRARYVERLKAFYKSLPAAQKVLLKGSNVMPYEIATDIGNPLNFQRAWARIAEDLAAGKVGSALSPRNLTEATIGILPDIMLRFTQATDLPVRQAERARIITELAEQRGLSDSQLQIALRDPKLASITEAEAARGRKGFNEDDLAVIESESAKAVFQQDNKGTLIASGINRFIRKEFGASGYIPYRLITLFQKTPINVAAEALQFTPAGAFQNWSNMTPRERNIARSRILLGAIVTTAFGYLYHKGVMTANLDTPGETNKARELAKSGGVQPPGTLNLTALSRLLKGESSEFKPGDTVVDLSSLGTAGALGIMAGTSLRQSERSRTNEEYLTSMMKAVPTSGLNFITEQQFLKGASDFIKLLSQESTTSLDRLIKNYAVTAASPVAPAILGAIRRAERDKLPVTGSQSFITDTINELNQRYAALGLAIPGAKDPNAMPVRRDLWGEAVAQTPKGSNPWVYQFFNAWKARDIDADPLNTSIYTIWRRTADNQAIPSVPNPSLTYRQKTYERMSPEQFDRYSELVGKYRRLRAEQEFMRGRFQQGGDERKLKLLQRAYDDGLLMAKRQFLRELAQSGQSLTPLAPRRGFQEQSEQE